MPPKKDSKIDPETAPGETPNSVNKAPFWRVLGVFLEGKLSSCWSHLGGDVGIILEAALDLFQIIWIWFSKYFQIGLILISDGFQIDFRLILD